MRHFRNILMIGSALALVACGADDVAARSRDVFVFFINGAKEKAPAAAGALIAKLGA